MVNTTMTMKEREEAGVAGVKEQGTKGNQRKAFGC